jgi:hypothetical protein
MNTTATRQRLSDYHSFLELAWAVCANHSPAAEGVQTALKTAEEFIHTASSCDIRERGRALEVLLDQFVKGHEKILPKKKGVREIAHDFRLLVKKEPDVWRFGVPHGWLSQRFDVSRLLQFEDLPLHARIGIGLHAGRVSIEEGTLLEDTFFLLVHARKSFDTMAAYAKSLHAKRGAYEPLAGYSGLNALNTAVCTYSRLTVLTSAAFVEAFVNSVGWNEAATRSDLSEQEMCELQGFRKGRYLSLESKLERMPRIIRPDKVSPIVIADAKQMREPFITFLSETKAVRDASMHCAPGKAPIVHPPGEWLRLAESAVNHTVAVAREFWSACYPDRQPPRYLAQLYYDGLQQQAIDRLTAAGAVTGKDA